MAIKESAIHGEYTITRDEKNSIKVFKFYDNSKAALREIASEIGFEVDPSWNTQQLGAKLIKEINK